MRKNISSKVIHAAGIIMCMGQPLAKAQPLKPPKSVKKAQSRKTKGHVIPGLDASFQVGNRRNIGSLDFFVPLTQSDTTLWFLDMRLIGDSKTNKEGNLGLIYRREVGEDAVAGGGPFIDLRQSSTGNTFSQLTFNAHFLTSTWQVQGNVYLPFTKKKVLTRTVSPSSQVIPMQGYTAARVNMETVTYEQALKGADIHVSYAHPQLPGLRAGVSAYHFQGKGFRTIQGLGQRLDYQINDVVKLNVEHVHDRIRKDNFYVGVTLTIPLSSVKKSAPPSKMNKLFSTRAVRDIDAVVAQRTDTTAVLDSFQAVYVDPNVAHGGDGSREKPFRSKKDAASFSIKQSLPYEIVCMSEESAVVPPAVTPTVPLAVIPAVVPPPPPTVVSPAVVPPAAAPAPVVAPPPVAPPPPPTPKNYSGPSGIKPATHSNTQASQQAPANIPAPPPFPPVPQNRGKSQVPATAGQAPVSSGASAAPPPPPPGPPPPSGATNAQPIVSAVPPPPPSGPPPSSGVTNAQPTVSAAPPPPPSGPPPSSGVPNAQPQRKQKPAVPARPPSHPRPSPVSAASSSAAASAPQASQPVNPPQLVPSAASAAPPPPPPPPLSGSTASALQLPAQVQSSSGQKSTGGQKASKQSALPPDLMAAIQNGTRLRTPPPPSAPTPPPPSAPTSTDPQAALIAALKQGNYKLKPPANNTQAVNNSASNQTSQPAAAGIGQLLLGTTARKVDLATKKAMEAKKAADNAKFNAALKAAKKQNKATTKPKKVVDPNSKTPIPPAWVTAFRKKINGGADSDSDSDSGSDWDSEDD